MVLLQCVACILVEPAGRVHAPRALVVGKGRRDNLGLPRTAARQVTEVPQAVRYAAAVVRRVEIAARPNTDEVAPSEVDPAAAPE